METNILREIHEPEQQQTLINLMPTNPGQTKYYCGRCEGWYLDEKTLIEHINLYHEYWCTICRLRLKCENKLRQHMLNVHCVTNRCESCRIVFSNSPEMTLKHMLEKHSDIRDKHAFTNNQNQESRVSTPVTIRRQPQTQNSTENSRYHATLNHSSEYLCAKCNLKFTNIQETAKHMMGQHQVEIGIRTFRDSGKEEIFIINNRGKIFTVPAQNNEHSASKEVTFDGGKTSLTITATQNPVRTSGGHQQLISTPTASTNRPRSSDNLAQVPPVRKPPTLQSNVTTMANSHVNNRVTTTVSPVQNGFLSNYASTPDHLSNSNKQKNKRIKPRQCKYCLRVLSSNFSLNRHLRTVHKALTQNPETTLKIDRILSQSEIEPFENSAQPNEELSFEPFASQSHSNNSDTESLPSVHVEIDNEDDIEVVEPNSSINDPPITIDEPEESEIIEAIESDSEMEITVLSEPQPSVPKPKPFVRVQPSSRFLRNLAKKKQATQTNVSKKDIAEKLKNISRHLSLKNKIMCTI